MTSLEGRFFLSLLEKDLLYTYIYISSTLKQHSGEHFI